LTLNVNKHINRLTFCVRSSICGVVHSGTEKADCLTSNEAASMPVGFDA
jgi:hypothetical protein